MSSPIFYIFFELAALVQLHVVPSQVLPPQTVKVQMVRPAVSTLIFQGKGHAKNLELLDGRRRGSGIRTVLPIFIGGTTPLFF